MYFALKFFHVGCVILSVAGFVIRGALKILKPQSLQRRWLKIAPHVVDSLLLISAFALAWQSRQYPLQQHWLTAKIIGLLFYIGFGMTTMRFAATTPVRVVSYILALLCAAYIIAVAMSHSATPWQ